MERKFIGIKIEDSEDIKATNNAIFGMDDGIVVKKSKHLLLDGNLIISSELAINLKKIEEEIRRDENVNQDALLSALEELKLSIGQSSAVEKYSKFIGLVADHVSLFPLAKQIYDQLF